MNIIRLYLDFIMVTITATIAILTIVGLYGGDTSPINNELGAILCFGLPALVLANGVLLVFWLIRLKKWAIIPLATLLGCTNFLGTMYQFDTRPESQAQEEGLVIASYNVEGFKNHKDTEQAKQVLQLLESQRVDIVCFQEYSEVQKGKKNLTLQLFNSVFPYHSKGVGGQMILSKFPVVKGETIKFEYGDDTNSAQYADIKINNQTFRIYNVHFLTTKVHSLLHNTADMQNDSERAKVVIKGWFDQQRYRSLQVDELCNYISTADNDTPTLLCGDFNDTPYTYTYQSIAATLKDGFTTAGHGFTSTFNQLAKGLLRIDFIFHSQDLHGLDYYSMKSDLSDHNPVFFKLKF